LDILVQWNSNINRIKGNVLSKYYNYTQLPNILWNFEAHYDFQQSPSERIWQISYDA